MTPRAGFTAYLIDPEQRTIEPVNLTQQPTALDEIYRHLGCRTISAVTLNARDNVYVDDEGLINGPVYQFFGLKGVGQPIAGRGLVVGIDGDGNDIAPQTSLDALKARVVFIERLFADLWKVTEANRPDKPAQRLMPLKRLCAQLGAEG